MLLGQGLPSEAFEAGGGEALSMNEIVLVSAYAASLRGGFVEGKPAEGESIDPWFP